MLEDDYKEAIAALRSLLEYPGGQYSEHGDFDAAWSKAQEVVKKADSATEQAAS